MSSDSAHDGGLNGFSSATPTAALDGDRPTISFALPLPASLIPPAPYLLAHTSDTTSTTLLHEFRWVQKVCEIPSGYLCDFFEDQDWKSEGS